MLSAPIATTLALLTLGALALAVGSQLRLQTARQRLQGATVECLVYAVLAVGLCALLVVSALAYLSGRDAQASNTRVEQTQEVRRRLQLLLSELQDVETGSRGYALTGATEYLEPYERGAANFDQHVAALAELLAGSPQQGARLAQLHELARERIAHARRVVDARRQLGSAAGIKLVASGLGKQMMDGLRSAIARMDAEEAQQLAVRAAQEQASVDRLNTTLAASTLLAIAGVALAALVLRRDFERRRRAEAALRDSEQSLAITLHSIGDAVLATDTAGRVTRMNAVAERLTGWPLDEALGRPVDEVFRIVNEYTRAAAVLPVAQVLASGLQQGLANHTLLLARDGREYPIADSAAPIVGAGGALSGVVLVFRDATLERQAEHQAREQNLLLEQRVQERTAQLSDSEARLLTVLENIEEGVVVSSLDGEVLYFNRAAMAMHGFSDRADYLRRMPEFATSFELRELDGALLTVPQWPLARIMRGETLRDWVLNVRQLQAGWQRIFSYGGTLARDADGRALLAIVTVRDISASKRAEREIIELNATLERRVAERTRQLEQASRAKSDFLASMSHELRTPLNAVIGFSEMLKDGAAGALTPRQHDFAVDIFDAGSHLLALINDILDLAKVEAGTLLLEPARLDLAALLHASTQLLRGRALERRIQLRTELADDLGDLLADERKLKQIVYNLLSNAIKFTPDGGAVSLRAQRCTRAELALPAGGPTRLMPLPPGDSEAFVAITVEDNGAGMTATELPRLFMPFSQVDSSLARRHAGTGLGLSLVYRLAQLHGGTVGVASRPGEGSRFVVWLPYLEPPAPPAPDGSGSSSGLHEDDGHGDDPGRR
ncbi:CHASE3 domain-containing protein [Paucibacter soli]|uniref:CHASE3 domain-containing protein n=1 Tax=Paucibacter soli TaxID=3133433 RepID=UPI0030B5B5B7